MKLRMIVALPLVTVAFSAAAAPELVVSSTGQLTGAKGVEINGALYDVAFADGTCADLFNGCDSPLDFFFQTTGHAQAAAAALLDQVLLDGAAGQFDSQPWMTEGCQDTDVCFVITPFTYPNEWGQAIAQTAINYVADSSDWYAQSAEDVNFDYHFSPHLTWAIWSRASGHPSTVGDREWLQPADVSGFSWDKIATVCNTTTGECTGTLGSVDLSGWTWASAEDVGALFRHFVPSFPVGLGEVAEIDSSWAPAFFDVFRASRAAADFNLLFGWTRTLTPVTSDTPYHAYISSVRDTFAPGQFDNLLNNSSDSRDEVRDTFGAWFYRPLPITLLQRLLDKVADAGPGTSLADKVTLAQTYYAVPDVQATCAVLTDFSSQVRAQRAKKLAAELADELTDDAQAIMTTIGCNSP